MVVVAGTAPGEAKVAVMVGQHAQPAVLITFYVLAVVAVLVQLALFVLVPKDNFQEFAIVVFVAIFGVYGVAIKVYGAVSLEIVIIA